MNSLNNTIIFIHDLTGKVLFSVPEKNGYIKNIKNTDFFSIIHPSQHDQAIEFFKTTKNQTTFEYYLDIKEQDEQYNSFYIHSRYFVNGNQQLLHSHLYPVWQQNTAQLSSDVKLLSPEEPLKFLLDKTNVPTILSQKDGRLIYCNEPALDLLKIKPEHTHSYFAQNFYTDPDSRPGFIKKLEDNNRSENIELKLKDNEGNYFWVLLNSRLIVLQGEEVLLNNLVNISYQKDIENKHKVTLERLELATNAAKIGIWEYDLLANNVVWNETMYQLINHEIEPGRNKFAFFVRNTSENQREQFITFLNNQEQTLVLNNQVNIDGQEKYFQTTCRKYYNNYAELIKVLGVTIDITELQDNKKQVNAGLQDEAVIAKITTLLNTTVEFETSINQVIELIGNHLKVDRIAIYYFNKKKNKCASFTWGFTEGLNNDSSKITLADLQLINQRVIYEDFSALPAAARKILTGAEHYKMCLCPLLIGEEQIGYVTFQQAKEKPWYNIKSEWIETIVNLISRAFEREEHHQEIKRQQNLLRNITNSLTDVITQTDIEGNIIYASPGWKDVTGFHPHEIIGKSAFNFIHPDDLPVVIAKFKSLAKSGTDSAQFRFLNKSGKFVWCETRSSLVLKKDNQIEGIITGGYVIEERVKVEMALRNNEQKYRTLFEKAPIGVLLVDSDGNIQEINHVLMQTFNLSSRDLQVSNVFHKSWLKKSPIFANIQHCTKNNQPVTGEEKFIHENNKVIIFKYYLNPLLIDDEITQVQAILIDITNQKQVEDALKKNQIKLQQITNNITDLITEVDMNGKIIYASPAWEFLLGYKPAEIINQSISKVLINSSASTLLNQIKRKAANKRKKTYQHQMKSKSGKIFWFESSGQTLTDDKNNKTGIVFGSSDITERKLAEQKLINQNEALKKANEELDSFVYRSSHDLKAPLTSVLGLINISKYSEEIPERNNFLLLMEQTITKLEKVIKQITDYSRNARLELTIEKIDFQKTWESLLDELSFLDKFDKIKFEFQLKQPTDFYSDRDRIFGIIKNILSNAIIYRSWNDKVNWINCTIEVAETQAIITIIDNGTGIVKEQQDKIFNMFHRSSNISKGAGLGLYIVKEMLQRLEGSIEFTSEPGKGSSFKVVVPNLKK